MAQSMATTAVKNIVLVAWWVIISVLHHTQNTAIQNLGRLLSTHRIKMAKVFTGYISLLLAVNLILTIRRWVTQVKKKRHLKVVENRVCNRQQRLCKCVKSLRSNIVCVKTVAPHNTKPITHFLPKVMLSLWLLTVRGQRMLKNLTPIIGLFAKSLFGAGRH